ncbi:MAG: hypothetical protein QOH21_1348 [Acidobacteriota bacterium]|nr:hypothetical protein [Acidobacteriota bacterium]
MTVANCPACAAPIEFAIGSSAVVVCGYCRSVVARSDRGVESFGKVAALVDTGSPLGTGMRGSYRNSAFSITGRTQMRHEAGGVWDEWYAAFDDGRWGWLAEAQGRYYVTFQTGAQVPEYEQLQLGARLAEVDGLMVSELGSASLASAEGELPWKPLPGESYRYADLTGGEQKFASIDFSETPPLVFKGYQVTLSELGIDAGAARTRGADLVQLNCSNCGGPLDLRAPDRSERIICPNCGSAFDVSAGKLQFFKLLKQKKVEPVIALGITGTIDGTAYVIAGFMQRSVKFDMTYYWTEYLLFHAEKGFRWLVHSDDHWSFVEPIAPGEVFDAAPLGVAKSVGWKGQSFRLFQEATARVTYVIGEFYWRVTVGEAVNTVDYVAPPFGLSKEVTGGKAPEIAWSYARYMQPEEVETAFTLKERLPRPSMVGPMQPYTGPKLGKTWLFLLVLLIAAAVLLAVTRPNRLILDQSFDLAPPSWSAATPAPAPPSADAPTNARIFLTEPFELNGNQNIRIDGRTGLQNDWLYVSGDLVEERTNALTGFEMEFEYYSGIDGGERWSEGSRDETAFLSAPPKGRYVLRVEAQWNPQAKATPDLHMTVREGVFRWSHFILALLALSVIPLLAMIRQVSFESQRWKESAHSPFGNFESVEDDDE